MSARLFAVAAVPVLAAGCGSSAGSPKVASLATTSTTSTSTTPIVPNVDSFARFVTCMRQHGIAAQLGPQGRGVTIVRNSDKAAVVRAQGDCQEYLPGGGPPTLTPAQEAARNRAMLAVSKCMRRNGVPNFPDPNAQGQIVPTSRIDKASPAVQAAAKKCSKLEPRDSGPRVR